MQISSSLSILLASESVAVFVIGALKKEESSSSSSSVIAMFTTGLQIITSCCDCDLATTSTTIPSTCTRTM